MWAINALCQETSALTHRFTAVADGLDAAGLKGPMLDQVKKSLGLAGATTGAAYNLASFISAAQNGDQTEMKKSMTDLLKNVADVVGVAHKSGALKAVAGKMGPLGSIYNGLLDYQDGKQLLGALEVGLGAAQFNPALAPAAKVLEFALQVADKAPELMRGVPFDPNDHTTWGAPT